MLTKALRRIFDPRYLIKPSLVQGEMPGGKEAYSTVLTMAWPTIAETFLIALISMIDIIMVSTVGSAAIAAVGLVTQPRFIVLTLVISLNVSVTAITARRRGEKDLDGAVRCLKQSLILSLLISVVLSGIAFAARRPMMLFAGAQPDTIELSVAYFEMILIGTPFNAVTQTICSAQRGVGNSKVSMVVNLVSNVVNLIFNFLLIGGNLGFPALGVRGAGIATVIGWTVGLVLALLSIIDRRAALYVLCKEIPWSFDKRTLTAMFQVGSGSFVEQLCVRIGFVSYSKIVAGLGTMYFASHQICMNILSLSFSFGEGLGMAASALVGQNLGAKRPDLSILYGKICQRLSFITCAVMMVFFTFFGRYMVMIFSTEPDIIAACIPIIRIAGLILIGQASQMIFMGSLRGAGDTRYTAIISTICIVIIRPLQAYIFAYILGWDLIGAWIALIGDQYLRLFLTERRFSSGKWMDIVL